MSYTVHSRCRGLSRQRQTVVGSLTTFVPFVPGNPNEQIYNFDQYRLVQATGSGSPVVQAAVIALPEIPDIPP